MGKEFIDQVAPIVQKLSPSYGIKCNSAVISQAIIESGWGDSVLSKEYHNYFGIKCGTNWNGSSVNMDTKEEYEPGVITNIKDNFRVYSNMEEGVKGYFELLQLSRYSNLRGVTDYKEYARLIKEDGYCTSSDYTELVIKVIEQNNLVRFDSASEVDDMPSKEYFAERMLYWCNEANLGYDQSNRWDIREGGECDCSSLVYWCLWEAGFLKKPSGSPYNYTLYTGTLRDDLINAGFTELAGSTKPILGDVLVNHAHHTAVCTGSNQISNASIDENGNATGGQSGDQTDRETVTRSYYNYPWDNVYRPPSSSGGSSSGSGSSGTGHKGLTIDEVANLVIQGIYGQEPDRSVLLKADGYDPVAVQKRVNEILKGETSTPSEPEKVRDRRLQLWEYNNTDNQRWWVRPIESNIIALRSVSCYEWLSNPGSSKVPVNAATWGGLNDNKDPKDCQKIVIEELGAGIVRLHSYVSPDLCLDVTGGVGNNGTTVQWYYTNDTKAQMWYKFTEKDGSVRLVNCLTMKALDCPNGGYK